MSSNDYVNFTEEETSDNTTDSDKSYESSSSSLDSNDDDFATKWQLEKKKIKNRNIARKYVAEKSFIFTMSWKVAINNYKDNFDMEGDSYLVGKTRDKIKCTTSVFMLKKHFCFDIVKIIMKQIALIGTMFVCRDCKIQYLIPLYGCKCKDCYMKEMIDDISENICDECGTYNCRSDHYIYDPYDPYNEYEF